ncbi:MAG TPA: hypothetical protein VK453_02395 [Micromonosporaceae bacterium]|nr:hypothetical protein [Micromonosporaceae bacterium]
MKEHSAGRPLAGSEQLQVVLSLVLDRVAAVNPEPEYRLVGTAAALIQGVPLATGDIDILVARRSDVDSFAAALSGFLCRIPPTWLPDARQYFARFDVDGTDVEISTVEWPTDSDTLECAGPGPWQHYVPVKVGQHVVPAVRLELRLVSELGRDRPDRYGPLIRHLRLHGADLDLVLRAMPERGVAPALQAWVVEQLRGTVALLQQVVGDGDGAVEVAAVRSAEPDPVAVDLAGDRAAPG